MAEQTAPPERRRHGLFVNVNLVFTATVAAYGLSFLVSVVLARALGPEGRGLIALYQSAIMLSFAVLGVGISVAALYFVSRGDQTPRQALESTALVTLAATAITAAIIAMIAPVFGDDLADEGVPYWMLIVAVPANIQFRAIEAVLRAEGRFMAMNLVELCQPLTLLVALLAVELASELTAWRAMIVYAASPLPATAAGYLLAGPSAWPRGLPGIMRLRESVVFGAQGQLGNIIQFVSYRLDSYLILLFVNTAGVGIYAVSIAMSEGMWFIANSVTTVLMPRLTGAGNSAAAEDAARGCRITILLTATAAAGLAITSPVLFPLLFGSDFDDAIVPFLLLLPGTIALAGGKVLSSYVLSRGRPLINSSISGVSFAVVLVADLLLVPWLEVEGAAIASSLAYLTSTALTASAYRRLSGAPLWPAFIPTAADIRLGIDRAREIIHRRRSAAEAGSGG
jgi:O-antigen/teichoic acid export membrane protein